MGRYESNGRLEVGAGAVLLKGWPQFWKRLEEIMCASCKAAECDARPIYARKPPRENECTCPCHYIMADGR